MALSVTIAAALAHPAVALAQSADDVASRVGTVARTMANAVPGPWTFEATFATDVHRGNADTTNLRTTAVYVLDSGAWRFGSYLSGSVETTNGARTNERAGLNLALARRFSPGLRLVLMEEIVRAPLDGLDWRNLLGGVMVWSPQALERVQTNVYAGVGWAAERYTSGPDFRADYAAGLIGTSATARLSPTSTLNLVGSFTQDLSDSANYKFGMSTALKAAINSLLGVHVSYALAYDNQPTGAKQKTNNAISAGLTLGFKGSK
jgi:putative salt-induced outer membrane protein YdiY